MESGHKFCDIVYSAKNTIGNNYTQFVILLSINFITWLISDVCFSKPVEKYRFRILAVGAPVLSTSGIWAYCYSHGCDDDRALCDSIL